MEDITKKIRDLLIENEVPQNKILEVLGNAYKDIESSLWEKIPLSIPLFYSLKDVVWYNLEHLQSGDVAKGKTTLKHMGSKFPNLIWLDDVHIEPNKLNIVLNELEEIRRSWSSDWFFVSLVSKTGEFNNGSEVILYEAATEKPSKYGYNPYQKSKILNEDGNQMPNSSSEIVLCSIESKLGSYGHEPLLRNFLENLIEGCKRAINFEKGIMLDTNSYNFS